jgi:hypothetical protein
MNKLFLLLLALCCVAGFSSTFAGSPPDNGNNTISYQSPDDELTFNIERGKGVVTFEIVMRDLPSYHHIIIEKSMDSPDNFGQCKYITCAEHKSDNGKITETDKYPYAANKGVYYRVKTVAKDGTERCYAAVLLPPLEDIASSAAATSLTKTNTNTNK